MSLTSGTKLGHYEILGPLGAGGMGEVYRARDSKLDRDVAVKVLPEEFAAHPDALARFEREAKAVAALNHPNILGIYEFGTEGSVAYAVMELLEEKRSGTGSTPARCRPGRPSITRARSPPASPRRTSAASSTGISSPRICS